jgi:ribonuclease HII
MMVREVPNTRFMRSICGTSVIGGIDEAGRGPVFGPLVVAGVAVSDPDELAAFGVKDSKRLSPAKRVRLARLIEDAPGVRIHVESLAPADLDARRKMASLNAIEVDMFRLTAKAIDATSLFLDAADVDAPRFGRRVGHGICDNVVSQHRADDEFPVVAAASIIAKVHRDAAIEQLKRTLERRLPMELGSGYPSDPKTKAFLAAWWAQFGTLPPGVRTSWKTVENLIRPQQAGLDAF